MTDAERYEQFQIALARWENFRRLNPLFVFVDAAVEVFKAQVVAVKEQAAARRESDLAGFFRLRSP